MRKSADLDNLLENAVAIALGLQRPHPEMPRKRRSRAASGAHVRQGKLLPESRNHAHAA